MIHDRTIDAGQPPNDLDGFNLMAKPTGPLCNLDCTYCFYLEKENLYRYTSDWRMPDAVLEAYVRQYIEAQHVPAVTFVWQGGEPTLLGVDFYRRAVELQKKYADGKRIENALQTNGILLDDEWGQFLAENRFLVGLSIDGPRALHDRYRTDRGGRPTFDTVLRGLDCLKRHRVEFNTLTVVQRHNSHHPLEVYRFLKEIGSRFIQFIPVVERIATTTPADGRRLVAPFDKLWAPRAKPRGPTADVSAGVSPWSVEPIQYGRFLNAVFDEWVRNDVGRVYVQMFDVALESWLGLESGLCVFRETCGAAMAIEHNGDIYSCDHYVYPEHKLGNIIENRMAELAGSEQQQRFGHDKFDALPRYCRECDVRFACNGECPKHRFVRTPDGQEGLNYLCPGYKLFFDHIEPYMTFMAYELRHEHAPANVMAWSCRRDKARAQKPTPGRNDPCSCGSGRKYKKCCGTSGMDMYAD